MKDPEFFYIVSDPRSGKVELHNITLTQKDWSNSFPPEGETFDEYVSYMTSEFESSTEQQFCQWVRLSKKQFKSLRGFMKGKKTSLPKNGRWVSS